MGREECVKALTGALNWVTDGHVAIVEVSGEPGIGKTLLLAEASILASESGLAVCSGQATQVERTIPLALFTAMLGPIGETDQPMNRVHSRAAMRRQLTENAGRGVALVLDDLHWADQASLELIENLIRHPPSTPLLMIVAFRTARSPIRIVDAITRAGRGVWRIHLNPLTAADIQMLLPDVSPGRRDLLMRASLGNPLYLQALTQLSNTALDELARPHDGRGAIRTDESTRQILRALALDLAGMAEPVRRIASAIAVIGDHAAVDLIAVVAELPVRTVVDVLDQLCGAGLGDLDRAWFRFHHPLMRAAAHDMTGPAWRLQAHARAAEYLRSRGGPLPLLAHHVERSAQYGDETAAATLLDAGTLMVYQAPATAARWLGAALRILSPTGPLLDRRPVTLLRYAQALGLAGELDRSWETLRELLCDGHPLSAEAAAFGLVIARLRGDLDTAAALRVGQLQKAGSQPVVEGKLQVQLAALAALDENAAAVMEHTQQALHLLDGRRPALGAAAQTLRAWAALHNGQPAAARTRTQEAARLSDTVSDVTMSPHVELLGPLAWVDMRLGDIPAATRQLTRAYQVIDQSGHSSALPYLLVVDAALQVRLGRLDAALSLTEQAALTANSMGSLEMGAMADAVRLQPLLWTFGPTAAIAVAQRLAGQERPRSRTWWRVARLNLAVAHAAAEDGRSCLDLLTDPEVTWPTDPTVAVTRQVTLAQGLAYTNDLDGASRAAVHAEHVALAAGLDYELGLAWYAKAFVAARAGRLDQASALVGESVAKFAVSRAAIEEARAHHLAGWVHARAGQPERSHDEFGRAKTGYAACAANWLLLTVTRDQRSCAARRSRRRPSAARVDALTSRERQIADLVAAGLSNQQIATRLFVSRRTVESHLSRIFPKLGVRSRVALACRMRE